MINIDNYHMIWNGHDCYVLSEASSDNSIFYVPTLKFALLITNTLATHVRKGVIPKVIKYKLKQQVKNAIFPSTERPKAFHLAIGLTNNCTLGCLYCHAEADKEKQTDRNLIFNAIEYAFKKAGETLNKTLSVSFAVGGEPTMNWLLFAKTIDYLRKLEKEHHCGVEKMYLSMTTNCYYGSKKREYIADKFDTLTLSLDGYSDIQNLHRPTRSGKGSYATVVETCKYFIKTDKVKVGIRGTVSAESVRYLKNIIEHFYMQFGDGYVVAFEPLIQVGRALNTCLNTPKNEDFAKSFWEAKKYGATLGIIVTTSAANIDRLVGNYCGAMSIPSFTICTNGRITACHRDQEGVDYEYGCIDSSNGSIYIDENKVKANIKQTEMPDYCKGCFAKWHCAGDCPDIRRIGYSRCDVSKFIIFRQLEEKLTHTGGVNA